MYEPEMFSDFPLVSALLFNPVREIEIPETSIHIALKTFLFVYLVIGHGMLQHTTTGTSNLAFRPVLVILVF